MFGLMRCKTHERIISDLIARQERLVDALAEGLFLAGDDNVKRRITQARMSEGPTPRLHELHAVQRAGRKSRGY